MRDKSSLTQDEKNLLSEMENFSDWLRGNNKDKRILLRKRQFTMWKRICGRLREHAIADLYVDKVDKYNWTFDGFKVFCIDRKQANMIDAKEGAA
jgi:hypothetical protein